MPFLGDVKINGVSKPEENTNESGGFLGNVQVNKPSPTFVYTPETMPIVETTKQDERSMFRKYTDFANTVGKNLPGDIERGFRELQAIGSGLSGIGYDVVGWDRAADKALEDYMTYTKKAEALHPVVASYKDIEDVGDAAQYAITAIAQNLPTMIPSLVSGGVGGFIARKVAQKAVATQLKDLVANGVEKSVAEKLIAQTVAKKIALGSTIGAAPASIGMEAGSIYGDVYQQTGEKAPGAALAFGTAAGAFDVLPEVLAINRVFGPSVTDGIKKSLIRRLGTAGAQQFLAEAPTEAIQTMIERGAVTFKGGEPVFNEQGIQEIIDSFLQGGLAGAGIGIATEAIGSYTRADVQEMAKTESKDNIVDAVVRDSKGTVTREYAEAFVDSSTKKEVLPSVVIPETGEEIMEVSPEDAVTTLSDLAREIAGTRTEEVATEQSSTIFDETNQRILDKMKQNEQDAQAQEENKARVYTEEEQTKAIKEISERLVPKEVEYFNRPQNQEHAAKVKKGALDGEMEDQRVTEKNIQNFKDYERNNLPKNATPETEVRVYRAGTGEISVGDFVTLDRDNAERYARQRDGAYVVSGKAKLGDLISYGGLKSEFIHVPQTKKEETPTESKKPSPEVKNEPKMTIDDVHEDIRNDLRTRSRQEVIDEIVKETGMSEKDATRLVQDATEQPAFARKYHRDEIGRFIAENEVSDYEELMGKSFMVSVSKIKTDETFNDAMGDILEGQMTMTNLPILVKKVKGVYEVLDGNHRLAEAMRAGASEVLVVDDEALYRRVSEVFDNVPQFRTGSLTLKTLQKLEGRETVSKQFISDLTNNPDLKQPERDLIRRMLEDEGDVVNVADFINKVKAELLPLKRKQIGDKSKWGPGAPRYENVNLPDDQRGEVANYTEHIYESPIKTSAGEVHFGGSSDSYFAHTRIEDMAARAPEWDGEPTRKLGVSGTRRVLELQSDLFQKGRLEREGRSIEDAQFFEERGEEPKGTTEKAIVRQKELARLEPYRNTWQDRIIREEVAQAARDGKTKLQFPTGKTAMLIEGLGETDDMRTVNDENLYPSDLVVGLEIQDANTDPWIITDVQGNGKFGAISKDLVDKYGSIEEALRMAGDRAENFDISGNVDENNPIFKFYEKEVGRYLKNRYGARRITNEQGVEWYEVSVTPDMAKNVLAFRNQGDLEDWLDEMMSGPTIKKEQTLAILQEFKDRLKIDFNVRFFDAILTGERAPALFAINGAVKDMQAWGVTLRGSMAFSEETAKITPAHEVVHFVVNNLDRMPEFGITREELFRAQKGGDYTTDEEQGLGEELAHGFERYWGGAQRTGFSAKIQAFFKRLSDYIYQVLRIPRPYAASLQRFYHNVLTMRRSGEVISQREADLSPYIRTEDGKMILDFGKGNLNGQFRREEDSLVNEAKKYKTAEEFVKAKTNAYHGTPNKEFDEFKLDIGNNTQNETRGLGVWVTPQEELAKTFSNKIEGGMFGYGSSLRDVGGTVMPVHLKLKNPKIYESTKGMETILDDIEKLQKEKPSITRLQFESDPNVRNEIMDKRKSIENKISQLRKEYQRDAFEHFMDDRDQFATYIQKGAKWEDRYIAEGIPETNKKFIEYLKKQGHDGIIIKGTKYDAKGTGHDVVDQTVVFDTKNVLTRSQLTDIWKQANGVKPSFLRKESLAFIRENREQRAPGGTAMSSSEDIAPFEGLTGTIVKPLQLPEMVRMSEEILGEAPNIKEEEKMSNKRGFFSPAKEEITLRADLFTKNNIHQASATLAHEIGHLIDWLPDKVLERGNLVGRLLTLHNFTKTTFSRDRGSFDPQKLITEVMKEVKKDAELSPELNALYNAELALEIKQEAINNSPLRELLKHRAKTGEFKGRLPEEFRSTRTQEVRIGIVDGKEVTKKVKVAGRSLDEYAHDLGYENGESLRTAFDAYLKNRESMANDLENIKAMRRDAKALISSETDSLVHEKYLEKLESIGGIDNLVIKTELKNVSKTWRPWDEATASKSYRAYRNNSKELYADALSMLLNDPGTLETMAPTFYKAFFQNIDNKPTARDAYFAMQKLMTLSQEQLTEERYDRQIEMMKSGDAKSVDMQKEREAEKDLAKRSYWSYIKKALVSRAEPVNTAVRKVITEGKYVAVDQDPRYVLNELNYLGGKIKGYADEKFEPIYKAITNAGIDWHQFGAYLENERIAAGDRSEIANPQGIGPSEAAEINEHLLEQLGEDGSKVMRENAVLFRKGVKDITKEAYESGLISEQLWKNVIEGNDKYVTFQTLEHIDDISAQIFGQIGTLKGIRNPANASMEKMLATIRAIERNKARKSVVDFFQNFDPEVIEEAEKEWGGDKMVYKQPKNKNKKLIIVMRDGKAHGYYLDRYIAESLERESSEETNAIVRVLRLVNTPFRGAFITYNAGFQAFNLIRDFVRFTKNTKEMSITKALGYYIKSIPAAKARAFGLSENPTTREQEAANFIAELEKSRVLAATINDQLRASGPEAIEEEDIKNILVKYGSGDAALVSPRFVPKAVVSVLEFIKNVGDMIETLPKAAGAYYMTEKFGSLDAAARDHIRKNIGSPDFLDSGTWKPMTNELFMFSNAIIQGVRSDYQMAASKGELRNPYAPSRAEWWWKTAKYNILPKMLMFAAVSGLMGDWLKKRMDDISEYDKTNYTIIPMGIDQDGKTVYVRIPQDEGGRLLSGIMWRMMRIPEKVQQSEGWNDAVGEIYKAVADVMSFTAGNIPSISPIVSAPLAGAQYLSGVNPYDFFRDKNVLTDDQFNAGFAYSIKPFLQWEFQELGGGIFYRFSSTESADKPKTALQHVLSAPLGSNIYGRFVKASNYGQSEKIQEIHRQSTQEDAARRITEKRLVKDIIESQRENKWTDAEAIKQLHNQYPEIETLDMKTRKKTFDRIDERFEKAKLVQKDNPLIDALIFATTNDERSALMEHYKSTMTETEYSDFKKELTRLKVGNYQDDWYRI